MTRDRNRRGQRVVVGEVSSAEIVRTMMPPRGHIEVRERTDGAYRVWYPDEGFIPCPPVCDIRHSHDYKQKMVESYYHPTDLDDALEWAYSMAEEREVKLVPFQGVRKKVA